MAANEEALSPDYLRRHFPVAWNTPDREETHARLGYDVIGETFRIAREWLGDGSVEPSELPLRVELAFSLRRTDEGLVVRVAKRQDDEPTLDPEARMGDPDEDRPALTVRYLEEHAVTTWDDERDRDGYAVLGYLIEQSIVSSLIEAGGADGPEARRVLPITVDTTAFGGGCTVVCGGNGCSHKHRH